jgi:ABC-2 type transport system permease protein
VRNILLIVARELGSYLRTPSGYLIAASVLFLEALFFNAFALNAPDGQPRLSSDVLAMFFYVAAIMTIAAGAMFSVRLLAEDRAHGTDVLFATSPVRESEIVIGKYLAAFVYLTTVTLISVYMPALILVHGKVSWGHIGAGYLGLVLLGAAVLGIGMFISSLTSSPFVAVFLTVAVVVLLEVCWLVAGIADPPFDEILQNLTLHTKHFSGGFQSGILRSSDIVFYLGVVYLSLLAATRTLQSRRWR